ncbi:MULTISPECIES: helix-turn-helix domain-containing protein [Emticicia]|uniref:helix-turn-helix domain-containing protein n=1 Tax=Emticicia TaxID=312278 RepID=UPI0020A04400|nr:MULTISPECIES: helix-turn-helix transcriptional regulator [Emticicia]UTA69606.1 helix-turn-helix domain-containing protein [Emticicia sp. 21SJ11W-3]
MNIGEKIRQARQKKGFSQENMADMLGISTTAYGDIERNKTELTIARATEIAGLLQVNIIELMGIDLQPVDFSMEKLQMENEKLKSEVEKWQLAAHYWREKFEQQRLLGDLLRIGTQQPQEERQKIGF